MHTKVISHRQEAILDPYNVITSDFSYHFLMSTFEVTVNTLLYPVSAKIFRQETKDPRLYDMEYMPDDFRRALQKVSGEILWSKVSGNMQGRTAIRRFLNLWTARSFLDRTQYTPFIEYQKKIEKFLNGAHVGVFSLGHALLWDYLILIRMLPELKQHFQRIVIEGLPAGHQAELQLLKNKLAMLEHEEASVLFAQYLKDNNVEFFDASDNNQQDNAYLSLLIRTLLYTALREGYDVVGVGDPAFTLEQAEQSRKTGDHDKLLLNPHQKIIEVVQDGIHTLVVIGRLHEGDQTTPIRLRMLTNGHTLSNDLAQQGIAVRTILTQDLITKEEPGISLREVLENLYVLERLILASGRSI